MRKSITSKLNMIVFCQRKPKKRTEIHVHAVEAARTFNSENGKLFFKMIAAALL